MFYGTIFKQRRDIIQYGITIHLGSWRIRLFQPKISPENQHQSSFKTAWEYWLDKAQKCLQSDPKPFQQVFNLKFFYLTELTYLLIPLAKHNLTMDEAIWAWFLHCLTTLRPKMLLFSKQCMHHALTLVLLCVPVLFTENARCQFVIAWYGFPHASVFKFLVLFSVCNVVLWAKYS